MAKGIFIRNGNVLVPCDERDRELLAKFKTGQKVLIEVKSPRYVEHHRLFFAVLRLVAENSEYGSEETLLLAIKQALGYVTCYTTLDGELRFTPKSIDFTSMGQEDFAAFFDGAVKLICERIIPGLRRDDLIDEVNLILEGRNAKPERTERLPPDRA